MKLTCWYTLCGKLNNAFAWFYYHVGYKVASRPYLAIFSGIVTSILLGLGFLRFHEVNRVEKLYIPQQSQAMKDLSRGSEHFLLKIRPEEFILKYDDDQSVLQPEIFKSALDIHNDIININGLDDICIKVDMHHKCFTQSPLALFNFTKKEMDNVKQKFTKYINSNNSLLNGRSWQMLFPSILGDFEINMHTGNISAKSIRVQYFLKYPDTEHMYDAAQEWELLYLSSMKQWQKYLETKQITLYFKSGRSANDDVLRSAKSDTKLAAVSLILMIIFCAVTLAKFHDPISGHFLLGLGGVLTLVLGIAGSFGFVLLIGNPFIAFTGVLPFLVLGIGIDNMFIITNCLDQQQDTQANRFEKIGKTMSNVGASITMTTVTDLVAFGVSTVTDFPAIRYFSIYVACSITYCYIMVLTLFLGLLSLDVKRIEENRLDGLPCIIAMPRRVEKCQKNKISFSRKMMRQYGQWLMKLPTRVCVFLFALVLLIASVFGMFKTDQSFDPYAYGLKDSAFTEFVHYRDKAYPNSFEISVICDEPKNFTDLKVQMEYVKLDSIAASNGYVRKETVNWMTEFLKWAKENSQITEGEFFYDSLDYFLMLNQQFYADIKFNEKKEISVSRMIMIGGEYRDSLFLRDEMLTLREDLKKKSKLPVYAVSQSYIFTEQFVIILSDTIRNIAITSCAIFIITIPYLVDPRIGVLVFSSFISLILELLAFMYIWNVSLNSLSMIIIVMAIGFTVDYSAHIAHAYNVSKAETTEQRIVEALETMGASVMMGGISTFIGICVTGFAHSGIFRVFFKMMFGMVVLGLVHGLVFLPVMLSIFCRVSISSVSTSEDDNNIKKEDIEMNSEGNNNHKGIYEEPTCSHVVDVCSGIKGLKKVYTVEVTDHNKADVNDMQNYENVNRNDNEDNVDATDHKQAYVNDVQDCENVNKNDFEDSENTNTNDIDDNENANTNDIEDFENADINDIEHCENANIKHIENNKNAKTNDNSDCENKNSYQVAHPTINLNSNIHESFTNNIEDDEKINTNNVVL